MNAYDAIGLIIGMVLGALLDIAAFCAIAAVPLAALAYLGIISQSGAMAGLFFVALLAAGRVVIVGAIRALNG